MIEDESGSFNLIDEPWIPCLFDDGTIREVSISDVFAESTTIRELATDQPTEAYAILRILLVIFWRSWLTNVPSDDDPDDWWNRLWEAGSLEPMGGDIQSYLRSHRSRFELFDGSGPFMQVSDLHTQKNEFKPPTLIMNDCESEFLSMAAGSGLKSLSFAEAARRLITTHAWDYSGIKSGAVGDPRAKGGKGYPIGTGWAGQTGGVVLHGDNLVEDLLLNTPARWLRFQSDPRTDLPVWERPPATARPRAEDADGLTPDGPCDQLTWQSRRVRLLRSAGMVAAVLVCNGDRIKNKNQFTDPMTGFRYSKNQSNKSNIVYMPQQHQRERTLWRGIQPLLVREAKQSSDPDHPARVPATIDNMHGRLFGKHGHISIELIGIEYGTQSSSVSEVIHEQLDFNPEILTADDPAASARIIMTAQTTMEAAIALGRFHGMVLQAAGGAYAFQADPTETLLADLTEPFKQWIKEVDPDSDLDEHSLRWNLAVRRHIERLAAEHVQTIGPKATTGRLLVDIRGRTQLVSAGTAFGVLRRRLKELLPTEDELIRNFEVPTEEGVPA